MDSTRVDHLSCYGYPRETTSHIDALCDDAVRYENAFAAAPWTPPSHASLFTGTYLSENGIAEKDSHLRPGVETIPSWLDQYGYDTLSISPTPVLSDRTWFAEPFDTHYDLWKLPSSRPKSVGEFRRLYLKHLPTLVRSGIMYYLRNTDRSELTASVLTSHLRKYAHRSQPFFAYTNLLSAHNPYNPPYFLRKQFDRFDWDELDAEKLDHLSNNGAYRVLVDDIEVSETDWEALKDRYDAAIAYADRKVGDIISRLKAASIYDETMIVVTADHGEHFGEHGRVYHHFSLYDELIHVPLIIKYPGNVDGGSVVTELVSHVDIFPTIKHLVTDGRDRTTSACSALAPRSEFERDRVFAEYKCIDPQVVERVVTQPLDADDYRSFQHDLQCVRTTDRKYVRVHGGQDLFFDLVNDPAEENNLLESDPDSAETYRAVLHDMLADELSFETTDARESPAVERRLRELGYR